MKYYPVFITIALGCFVIIPFSSIHAQYVSPYNSGGNVKTVEQRRYDENKSKQNSYTPKPAPTPTAKPEYKPEPRANSGKPTPAMSYESGQTQQSNVKPLTIINGYGYGEIEKFHEGFAVVNTNGKFGYIDETGRPFVPLQYDYAVEFNGGIACVKKGGMYGFINKSGALVIPLNYDKTGFFCQEECVSLRLNKKWGFLDTKGKIVIPFIYEQVRFFTEGLAAVKLNNKWGFVDKTANVAVAFKYDDIFDYSEGIACVKSGYYWGFIDYNGFEIVPPIYADSDIMNGKVTAVLFEGKLRVKLNGKTSYFDKKDSNGTRGKPHAAAPGKSKEDRLKGLKNLFEKELITKEEYERAEQKILNEQ